MCIITQEVQFQRGLELKSKANNTIVSRGTLTSYGHDSSDAIALMILK